MSADVATGAVVLAAGLVALRPRRGRATGVLLCLTGVAWWAGSAIEALVFLHRGPLLHVLLAYPRGQPRGRSRHLLVIAAYVCAIEPVGAAIGQVLFVLVALAAVERWVSAGGIERRAAASAMIAAVAVCASGVAQALTAYEVAVALAAVGLSADLLTGRWARGVITGLMLDVGRLERAAPLAEELGRAVGDRSLAIAHREGDGWVDEVGRALDPHMVTTPISAHAALVHEPATLADPELARAAVAAARLALGNARLTAEVAASVEAVEASARRLVTAGDAERRRLVHAIEHGPERALELVARRLAPVDPDLAHATEDAGQALRDFAGGLRPRRLTDDGLPGALAELATGTTTLRVTVQRFDPVVESTVYFVCSEALANVAKHAQATAVQVIVEPHDGRLVAEITDDGVGGAATSRGSGLRGVADRVEALGGRLTLTSPSGAGTAIHAEIPL